MTVEPTHETPTPRPIVRNLAVVVAIAAFLTLVSPFGATRALPLWGAFIYWLMLIAEGWFGGALIGRALERFPALGLNARRVLATLLVAGVIAATVTAIQWAIGDPIPAWFLPTLYGLVLGISIAVAAIGWLMERAFGDRLGAVTHAAPTGATPVRFLERLPAKLRGAAIYAVSAEDHYLRLHTSKGSDLILMRLSDAVAELEGLEGAQTHRSWWVARAAVESVRRDGDKVTLVIKSGAEAPVSRPNLKPLRDAGWF